MAGFRRKLTEAQEEWIIPLTERNDGENKLILAKGETGARSLKSCRRRTDTGVTLKTSKRAAGYQRLSVTCTSGCWLPLCEANKQSLGSVWRADCEESRRAKPWLPLPGEPFGPSSTDSLRLMTESLIFEMISLFSASKRSKWSIFSCNIESWP